VNNPQTRRGDSRIAPTPKISPPPSDSRRIAPTPKISQPSSDDRSKTKSLGRLIGTFKTVSTKQINQIRKTPGTPIWQRNYYEHIVRHETRLQQIRQYIVANPVSWQQDHLHPSITFDAIP
jgi:REP element-mobilizing transposase RayT